MKKDQDFVTPISNRNQIIEIEDPDGIIAFFEEQERSRLELPRESIINQNDRA